MIGNGAFAEVEGRVFERSGDVRCVPATIDGGAVEEERGGEEGGFVIEEGEEAGFFLECFGGSANPVIADEIAVVFFSDSSGIEVGFAGEFGLFGFEGVVDHTADGGRSGAVESGHEG